MRNCNCILPIQIKHHMLVSWVCFTAMRYQYGIQWQSPWLYITHLSSEIVQTWKSSKIVPLAFTSWDNGLLFQVVSAYLQVSSNWSSPLFSLHIPASKTQVAAMLITMISPLYPLIVKFKQLFDNCFSLWVHFSFITLYDSV